MLVTRDDGYEPNAVLANTLQMIEWGRVFGLIGAVATPTIRAALALAEAGNLPLGHRHRAIALTQLPMPELATALAGMNLHIELFPDHHLDVCRLWAWVCENLGNHAEAPMTVG